MNRVKGEKELSPVEIAVFANAFGVSQSLISENQKQTQ
jgi:hypothetical protein